jgi:hypothetical protein
VSYHGIASVTSQPSAQLTLAAIKGERPAAAELILPPAISRGSWDARHPQLSGTFNAPDEEVFQESFRSELEHFGLFTYGTVANAAPTNGDVYINLVFADTVYFGGGHYVLYAEMQIDDGGGTSRAWRYVADSNDGLSIGEAMSINGAEGKNACGCESDEQAVTDV